MCGDDAERKKRSQSPALRISHLLALSVNNRPIRFRSYASLDAIPAPQRRGLSSAACGGEAAEGWHNDHNYDEKIELIGIEIGGSALD